MLHTSSPSAVPSYPPKMWKQNVAAERALNILSCSVSSPVNPFPQDTISGPVEPCLLEGVSRVSTLAHADVHTLVCSGFSEPVDKQASGTLEVDPFSFQNLAASQEREESSKCLFFQEGFPDTTVTLFLSFTSAPTMLNAGLSSIWWKSMIESWLPFCHRTGSNCSPVRIKEFLEVGEGNGTPLQYSYLENLMDGGAW